MTNISKISLQDLQKELKDITTLKIGKSGGRKVAILGKEYSLNQVVMAVKRHLDEDLKDFDTATALIDKIRELDGGEKAQPSLKNQPFKKLRLLIHQKIGNLLFYLKQGTTREKILTKYHAALKLEKDRVEGEKEPSIDKDKPTKLKKKPPQPIVNKQVVKPVDYQSLFALASSAHSKFVDAVGAPANEVKSNVEATLQKIKEHLNKEFSSKKIANLSSGAEALLLEQIQNNSFDPKNFVFSKTGVHAVSVSLTREMPELPSTPKTLPLLTEFNTAYFGVFQDPTITTEEWKNKTEKALNKVLRDEPATQPTLEKLISNLASLNQSLKGKKIPLKEVDGVTLQALYLNLRSDKDKQVDLKWVEKGDKMIPTMLYLSEEQPAKEPIIGTPITIHVEPAPAAPVKRAEVPFELKIFNTTYRAVFIDQDLPNTTTPEGKKQAPSTEVGLKKIFGDHKPSQDEMDKAKGALDLFLGVLIGQHQGSKIWLAGSEKAALSELFKQLREGEVKTDQFAFNKKGSDGLTLSLKKAVTPSSKKSSLSPLDLFNIAYRGVFEDKTITKEDMKNKNYRESIEKVLLGTTSSGAKAKKMTDNLGALNRKLNQNNARNSKDNKIPLDQVDEATKSQLFKNLLLDPKDQVELDWGNTADGKPLPKLKGAI